MQQRVSRCGVLTHVLLHVADRGQASLDLAHNRATPTEAAELAGIEVNLEGRGHYCCDVIVGGAEQIKRAWACQESMAHKYKATAD